jgi:hypothetical protein
VNQTGKVFLWGKDACWVEHWEVRIKGRPGNGRGTVEGEVGKDTLTPTLPSHMHRGCLELPV